MKKLLLLISIIISLPSFLYAEDLMFESTNIYEFMTDGECKTQSCFSKNFNLNLTDGQCETLTCFVKYSTKQREDSIKDTYGLLTDGKCSTYSCYQQYCLTNVCYSGSSSYNYDVSGYGDTGYTYGGVDADSYGDVDGYLYLEDGSEVYFDGEFTSKGEIEGYDENGNYYYLEVD